MATNGKFAILIAFALSAPMLMESTSIGASAASGVIFQDDFELTTLSNDNWTVCTDRNAANNGSDFWGSSSYNKHSGARSAWCSYIGIIEANGTWNYQNHFYDQNMWAILKATIDIAPYESASLSFYYWAFTGTLDDHLDVVCGNESGDIVQLWTQNVSDSGGWKLVTVSLPIYSVYIEFNFTSDAFVGGGPYEGVYIDDCSITATESAPPVSSAGSLPTYCTDTAFNVTYNASDNGGSGVDYVELWYRKGTSGPFIKSAFGNGTGCYYGSPIRFETSMTGDGLYQIYTIAVDEFGNREGAPPGNNDTWTRVDTIPPWTGLIIDGTEGLEGWYKSAVTVMTSLDEDGSGIASVEYMITGGPQKMNSWQTYDPAGIALVLDGNHSIAINMTDNAGNNKIRNGNILVDKVAPSTDIEISGTMGNGGWYTTPVNVNLTASDATSGIFSIYYYIDGGATTAYDGNFSVVKGGTTTVSYFSVDNAGNSGIGTTESLSFKLDPIGPACEMVGTQPVFTSSNVSINWQGWENDSGIEYYEISFDGESFVNIGNRTSTNRILTDGLHTFRLRGADIAGNNGTVREFNFTVDTNIFSPTGPMGPLLDIAILLPIVAVVLFLILRWRKKAGTAGPPNAQ